MQWVMLGLILYTTKKIFLRIFHILQMYNAKKKCVSKYYKKHIHLKWKNDLQYLALWKYQNYVRLFLKEIKAFASKLRKTLFNLIQ